MSSSRLGSAALLAATVVLLSSCGSASPGTAARIGDEQISVAQVDDLAEALCLNVEEDMASQGQAVPMSLVRQSALNVLALTEVAHQVADEYDVEPGVDYERQQVLAAEEGAGLPEDLQDDYVVGGSIDALLDGVIRATGAKLLAEEGVVEPTEEEIAQRGAEQFWSWPDSRELEINPVFDMSVSEGQLRPAAGASGVGVAVSDTALADNETEVNPEHVATLPEHLRCG